MLKEQVLFEKDKFLFLKDKDVLKKDKGLFYKNNAFPTVQSTYSVCNKRSDSNKPQRKTDKNYGKSPFVCY